MHEALIVFNTIIISFLFFLTMKFFEFWKRTGVSDFLIMTGIFGFGFLAVFSNNVSLLMPNSAFWFQMTTFSFNTVALFYVLFSLNLKKIRFRKVILFIALGWYFLLAFLLIFWKVFPQPDNANVLFIFDNLPNTRGDAHPNGAGLSTSWNGINTIIYSTSHQLLGILFWFLASLVFLYQTTMVELPAHQSPEITSRLSAVKFRYVAVSFFLIAWVLTLFPFPVMGSFSNGIVLGGKIFVIAGHLLLATTVLNYPESLVFTKYQFPRTFRKIANKLMEPYHPSISKNYFSTVVSIISTFNLDGLSGHDISLQDTEEPFSFYIAKSSLIRYQQSFQEGFNATLVSNFLAAFSSFSDEVFEPGSGDNIQQTRNGSYEVFVLIKNGLMFSYIYKGMSLLLHTKMKRVSEMLLAIPEINSYLYSEKAELNFEINGMIKNIVDNVLTYGSIQI